MARTMTEQSSFLTTRETSRYMVPVGKNGTVQET